MHWVLKRWVNVGGVIFFFFWEKKGGLKQVLEIFLFNFFFKSIIDGFGRNENIYIYLINPRDRLLHSTPTTSNHLLLPPSSPPSSPPLSPPSTSPLGNLTIETVTSCTPTSPPHSPIPITNLSTSLHPNLR